MKQAQLLQLKCGGIFVSGKTSVVRVQIRIVFHTLRPELWPKMHIRVAMAITSGCTPNFHTSERIPDDTPFYKTEKSVETSLKLEDCEMEWEKVPTFL